MDFSSICRTCLGTEDLTPIFQDDDHIQHSATIFITTGVQIIFNDGLPQTICKNCSKTHLDMLKFRQQCKDVEMQLLSLQKAIQNEDETKNKLLRIKKKQSYNLKYEYIDVKIEEDASESDEVPLKNLIKTDKTIHKNQLTYYEICIKNDVQTNNVETVNDLKLEDDYLDIDDSVIIDNNMDTPETKQLNDVTNIDVPFTIIDVNTVTCNLCMKVLSKRSIDLHMSTKHPGADKRKVKCELCDKYVLKKKIPRHLSMMHGNGTKCAYCKTDFNNKEMLKKHTVSCTAKKRKRNPPKMKAMAECEVCHKVMLRASLKLHTEIQHAGMGPVCEHCGRRFGNKLRLIEHLRSKHGHRKLACTLCEFTTASNMALTNHIRRHRGEKPYVCDACGAKFHASYLLVQHNQSHRTGKMMQCNLCPAAFKANNTLHMHKLTCHNTHSYQCNMCPKTFRCRHYAVKHLRNVHRVTGPIGPLQCTQLARLAAQDLDVRPTTDIVKEQLNTIN